MNARYLKYTLLLMLQGSFVIFADAQHVARQVSNKNIGDYLYRDNISHTIIVSSAGDGDFVTVREAFESITNSSFDNQYEVIVQPGRYKESSLTIPPFTHLKGAGGIDDVTIFDDKVRAPWIVDQRYSSKMSNLTLDILNSEAYVIHYDAPTLAGAITVNSNLNIIHRGGDMGAAVIGGGSWDNYLSVWQNCRFAGDKGQPACHTKQNSRNAIDLRFINCSFSSGFSIGAVGGYEPSSLTLQNCSFGEPCTAFISLIKNEPELWKYPANNLEWNIFGSGNKGFLLDITGTRNKGECLVIEAKDFNKDINISGTASELLFGAHYTTIKANKRIKGRIRGSADVRDVQSGLANYSVPIDVIQLWKRLGDCTRAPKDITITGLAGTETIAFRKNYADEKISEKDILAEMNAMLRNYIVTKDSGVDVYDVMNTPEKKLIMVSEEDGIIKNEFIITDGYKARRAGPETPLHLISGMAVADAAKNELLKVWSGSFIVALPDGEYGIGKNYLLSTNAKIKLGAVRKRIFYPYY